MNWYSIFYWLTVADNVSLLFAWLAGLSTAGFCVAIIIRVWYVCEQEDTEVKIPKGAKRWFSTFMYLTIVFWLLFVFTPSKKDCLLIIAGGAVGNFITTDSSAAQIPADITLFLHQSLQSEITDLSEQAKKEVKNAAGVPTKKDDFVDKLKDLSKEEIIKQLQSDTTVKVE